MKESNLILIICFLMVGFVSSHAQQKLQHAIHLGIPTYVIDFPKNGIYVGYNLSFPLLEIISLEAQLSYSLANYNRSDDFFTHDGGRVTALNALVGGRLYFVKRERKVRPYVNALFGYSYVQDHEYSANDQIAKDNFHSFGYSLGGYLSIRDKVNLGMAFENHASFVFKAGYIF